MNYLGLTSFAMLKYCGDIEVPSKEECYAIIKGANTPLKVIIK